jgi:hypothetical protein
METGDDSLPSGLVQCKTVRQIQAGELDSKVYEVYMVFFDNNQVGVYKNLMGLQIRLMYESFLERGILHEPLILSLTLGVVGRPKVTVTEITEAGITDITETGVTQTPVAEVTKAANPGVTEAANLGVMEVAEAAISGIPEAGVTEALEVTVQPNDGVIGTPVATHLGESSKNPSKKSKGKGKKRVDDAARRKANYFATPHEHGVDVITRALLVKFNTLGFGAPPHVNDAPPHVNDAVYRGLCEVNSILVPKLHCMAFHYKDNRL